MYSKSYPRYYGDVWWKSLYPDTPVDFESFTPFDMVPLDPAAEAEYLSTKAYADPSLDAEQQREIAYKMAEEIYKAKKYGTMSTEKLQEAEFLIIDYVETALVMKRYFSALNEYPAGLIIQQTSDEKAEAAFYVEYYMWGHLRDLIQGELKRRQGELKRRKNLNTSLVVGFIVAGALLVTPTVISFIKRYQKR